MSKLFIQTVTGLIDPKQVGTVDAHNHVWLDPVPGVQPPGLVLDNADAIQAELVEYRQAGGGLIVDCQPSYACGRNGARLHQLSQASGVAIVASTGFHLPKYYPPQEGISFPSCHCERCTKLRFGMRSNLRSLRSNLLISGRLSKVAEAAYDHFVTELTVSLEETAHDPNPVRAGMIKIACQATLATSPLPLLEAAAVASQATGVALQVHTDMGADAEQIATFFIDKGVAPGKLILCHMDKRPDFALHQALAQSGFALEYDTFYRPKYKPDENLWPLLIKMIEAGLSGHVILATDMITTHWLRLGGAPGLTGLFTNLIPRLQAVGFSGNDIRKLTKDNIASRLATFPAL